MIYDLWIINHHRWLKDLKSLKSNQPKFELRFRFIIQLTSDLAEHCSWVSRRLNFGRLRCVQFRGNRHRPNFCLLGRGVLIGAQMVTLAMQSGRRGEPSRNEMIPGRTPRMSDAFVERYSFTRHRIAAPRDKNDTAGRQWTRMKEPQ